MTRSAASAVAVVGLGLAAPACGGDDDPGPTASIPSVPTTTGALPRERETEKKTRNPPRKRGRGGSRAEPPGTGSPAAAPQTALQRAIREAAKDLPPDKRGRAVSAVTRSLLGQFGLTASSVTVNRDGTAVRATLSGGQACRGSVTTERSLETRLREAIPWLRAASVVVGSSGEPMSGYVRANCRPMTLPSGPGRVVMTARGTALKTTPAFTVRSRRWTVEYINVGTLLQAFVMRGDLPSGDTFQVFRRGPGRRVLSGIGRFRLQVAGTGEWVVRVRDGA